MPTAVSTAHPESPGYTEFTYADPRVCPSCRTSLPEQPARCPACDVALGLPLASEVFEGLQRVDRLVGLLRTASRAPVQAPTQPPVQAPVRAAVGAPVPDLVPTPLPMPDRTGVRRSSVPAILLGLGALCLLVAAVAFLAVAWSWLGVGGRTAVLVALTGATAVGGLLLHRRGLRVAAESLLTVSLGLLVLDLFGAQDAGWLGAPSDAGLAVILGTALTAYAAVLALVDHRLADRDLAVPQVTGVLGLLVAVTALPGVVEHEMLVAALAAIGFVALARCAQLADLSVALWSAVVATALVWLDLVVTASVAAGASGAVTAPDLWTSGSGAALTTAALLLLAPLLLTRDRGVAHVCVTLSATALTGLLALPVLDNGATPVALVSLAAGVAWTVVAHSVPRRVLAVPVVPAALSLLPAGGITLALGAQALASALTPDGLWLAPSEPVAEPWLLVPVVLAAASLALVLVPGRRKIDGARTVGAAVLLAAVATLALHPVPLWTVVAALSLPAAAYAVDALRRDGGLPFVQAFGAAAVLVGTSVVALPDSGLQLLPLVLLTATAAANLLVGRFDAAAEIGGLALPPSLALLLWTAADVVDLDVALRALPVLLALGALVLLRPRVELELTAAAAGFVAAAVAVPAADDVATSLALHLTLGGALVVAQSLVHPARRRLAWLGSALLVLATWVRLVDLGVEAPEPYTLPAAAALVTLGVLRLRRDRDASTRTTLMSGLVLATVPSLLQVMQTDPVSLRAALLGIACLALVLLGTRLQWSSPLVVGATVGGLLALVELSPYAGATPQWVVIGLVGTVLTVVGVTWERRVVDLRRAAQYVGRLR